MSHQLPELPEPEIEGGIYNQTHKIMLRGPVHFTADQMRAYAELAIEPYDEMLRALCCYLSVGGYNSDGLIPPDVADKKIRDGIDMFIKVERQRAIASVKREPLSGNTGELKREPLSDDELRALYREHYFKIGGYIDFARAIEQAHGITASKEDGE